MMLEVFRSALHDPTTLFFVGILAQAVFLLAGTFRTKDIGFLVLCVGAGALGMVPGKSETVYDPYIHLFLAALYFSVAYALFFKKRILQYINREVLLLWNFVFLYIYFQHPPLPTASLLTSVILGASAVVIANAFLKFDTQYYWKAYFYVWFLILIVGIASSHFAFASIAFFFTNGQSPMAPAAEMFFIGSAFLYLVVNAWYVIELSSSLYRCLVEIRVLRTECWKSKKISPYWFRNISRKMTPAPR